MTRRPRVLRSNPVEEAVARVSKGSLESTERVAHQLPPSQSLKSHHPKRGYTSSLLLWGEREKFVAWRERDQKTTNFELRLASAWITPNDNRARNASESRVACIKDQNTTDKVSQFPLGLLPSSIFASPRASPSTRGRRKHKNCRVLTRH